MSGALLAGTAAPSQAAGPPPNTSIFFYAKSLGAVTGTLDNGHFTQTANVSVPDTTAAALTRDTLLLYNGGTGQGTIGTFKGGHLSTLHAVTGLGTGFKLAAGSCDTALLYNPISGKALVLLVSAGAIKHRKAYQLPKQLNTADASCDTVSFYKNPPPAQMVGTLVLGTLKKGLYTHTSTTKYVANRLAIAHSTHSFLRYDLNLDTGIWGASLGGKENPFDSASFSVFEAVAGTANSVLLYEWQSGSAAFAQLAGGVYSFVGATTLSAGWDLIVGGK